MTLQERSLGQVTHWGWLQDFTLAVCTLIYRGMSVVGGRGSGGNCSHQKVRKGLVPSETELGSGEESQEDGTASLAFPPTTPSHTHHINYESENRKGVYMQIADRIWMQGRFTVQFVGQQKVVEAKNGITEQIESDNLQYLFALLTTASHITSHA